MEHERSIVILCKGDLERSRTNSISPVNAEKSGGREDLNSKLAQMYRKQQYFQYICTSSQFIVFFTPVADFLLIVL
jgi:hypothetical protein